MFMINQGTEKHFHFQLFNLQQVVVKLNKRNKEGAILTSLYQFTLDFVGPLSVISAFLKLKLFETIIIKHI